ncbi:phosphoribosylformylglycinamidine cyclo-ligase chloroplastic/mitochondrial-like, partial [Trifolium medium]|nr:phosphoribosylformylglycinamidine cyclo-ligase chloroplastic/mitochondrial-like [Trifolium medium]
MGRTLPLVTLLLVCHPVEFILTASHLVLAQSGLQLKDKLPGGDITIAEALMAPTTIYVKQVLDIVSKGGVKGIAHITGGGFTDNIPRVFPEGL